MGARLEGFKGLTAALENMTPEIERQVSMGVKEAGEELRMDIIKRYNRGPASGRTYQKYNPRRTHKASAPGQAPMTDTGRLANGTRTKNAGHLAVEVFNLVRYASILEYGSRRIKARPAWVPATEKMRARFVKILEYYLKRAMK